MEAGRMVSAYGALTGFRSGDLAVAASRRAERRLGLLEGYRPPARGCELRKRNRSPVPVLFGLNAAPPAPQGSSPWLPLHFPGAVERRLRCFEGIGQPRIRRARSDLGPSTTT